MSFNDRVSPGMMIPSRSLPVVIRSLSDWKRTECRCTSRSRCTGFMSSEAEKCSFTSGSEEFTIRWQNAASMSSAVTHTLSWMALPLCLCSTTVRSPEYVTFHKFRLLPSSKALERRSCSTVRSVQHGRPSLSVVERRRESVHGPSGVNVHSVWLPSPAAV